MEKEPLSSDVGISQQLYNLGQIIDYLQSGKTTAYNLERIDRFVKAQCIHNSMPQLREKLFELLLMLRLEQIANAELSPDFRAKMVADLEQRIQNPGNAPHSFFEGLDMELCNGFKFRVKDNASIRDRLLDLHMKLDGLIVSRANSRPHASRAGRHSAFIEKEHMRRGKSSEWHIPKDNPGQQATGSMHYPLRTVK